MVTPPPGAWPAVPIVVALDVADAEQAVRLAGAVSPWVGGFKIGLGLLHGPGPATVAALAGLGKPVFADAKLHDIPSQVEAAARRLGEHGARWVTTHASGGPAMLEAAVAGLHAANPTAGILAVTVLTSLDDADLAAVGIASTPGRLVSRMARVAAATGCEGVVCSPRELAIVSDVAPGLRRVTPGIRPTGTGGGDDQSRTADPVAALHHGSDLLVIGRPITQAPDPAGAARRIAESIRDAPARDG